MVLARSRHDRLDHLGLLVLGPRRWWRERVLVTAALRKVTLIVLGVVALYFVLTQPERAADVTRSVWNGIVAGIQAIFTFFDSLTSG